MNTELLELDTGFKMPAYLLLRRELTREKLQHGSKEDNNPSN
jgi:hypothetical protein